MKKQTKNFILVLITALILSACGQLGTAPASINTPEPVIAITESPAEIPTEFPSEDMAPERFDQYVGLIYPPLPDDLSPRFSMIIQGSDDNGLSLFSVGKYRMLWLSKLSHYDESSNPVWEVTDVLDLSNVETGALLIPDGCSLNGQIDNEILVVAKNGHAILAWRANTSEDRFEVLAADGIACDSDKAVRFE